MLTTYILTITFLILFVINIATFASACYTGQNERVIFASRLATALTMSATIICLIVTIALHLGIA